jgi:hypothetical protein
MNAFTRTPVTFLAPKLVCVRKHVIIFLPSGQGVAQGFFAYRAN